MLLRHLFVFVCTTLYVFLVCVPYFFFFLFFYFFFFFFFFSSRRRHTRCLSDWSSDVCSSDLARARRRRHSSHASPREEVRVEQSDAERDREAGEDPEPHDHRELRPAGELEMVMDRRHTKDRSEERRVGKEWRARSRQNHKKKN